MFSTLRARLTVWYLGLFGLLFVLFGVFFYGVLARGLVDTLDETLSAQSETARAMFLDELSEMHGDTHLAAAEVVEGIRGNVVGVFTGATLLAASPTSEGMTLMAAQSAAGDVPRWSGTVPSTGTAGFRAVRRRLTVGGQDYAVIVMEPLTEIAADLRTVRVTLLAGLPLLLALAGLAGYLLARRNLAPLVWMAEQAGRMGGQTLDVPLKVGKPAQELALLADAFNGLLSRLDESFKGMKQFVADASHELRTPLSIIRGEADVALSRERDGGEYRQSLAVILDEARRLSRLVDDLLNLALADSRQNTLDIQQFYLNDLLNDACRSMRALAEGRGIVMECLSGQEAPFRGDEELLRRLVLNLLDNSVRHTPAGGKITVALEDGAGRWRIRVSDTGAGIPPEALPHVFDRFYRADPARSRRDGGCGLGLAIVKWIAESHRGEVAVSSRPEAGTTFTVTLPR